MKRYKQKYFEVGPMEEHHNGDWVRYEDAITLGEEYSDYVASELQTLDDSNYIDVANTIVKEMDDYLLKERKVWQTRLYIISAIALFEALIIGMVI